MPQPVPSPPQPISSAPSTSGFEEVEHTADWAYHIWAPDHRALFLQAVKGLYALVDAQCDASPRITRTITLQAVDYESLLVAWLNELLHLRNEENLIFDNILINHLDDTSLNATLTGSPVCQWTKDIKAATYHDLVVAPTDTGFEATLILDV